MSAALDAIRALNQSQGPRCKTGIFLEMHPDLADTVNEALEDPTIQARAISRWLKAAHNVELGYDSLRRHRRGDCNCE